MSIKQEESGPTVRMRILYVAPFGEFYVFSLIQHILCTCTVPRPHTQTHIEIINAILGIRFLHLIELQENWAHGKRVRRGQAVSNDVLIMHNYELHALSHSALFSLSLSLCLSASRSGCANYAQVCRNSQINSAH